MCILTTGGGVLRLYIDKTGLHTPDKGHAYQASTNAKECHTIAFILGLLNYYGRFLANLSILCQPLNHLLRKDTPWKWTNHCQQVFRQVQEQLASAKVLVHYNSELPLSLACNASSYGVGAALSHTFLDGAERPIAFASRSLSPAEQNYSQMDKEALSLVFGVKGFHQYLYGRKFVLMTDRNPLTTILSQKQKVSSIAAARQQIWALLLSAYKYDLKY